MSYKSDPKVFLNPENFSEFSLCYVENSVAFFTSAEVVEQDGEGWGDAPYHLNASKPSTPRVYRYTDGSTLLDPRDWNEDGTPAYQLIAVYFKFGSDSPLIGSSEYRCLEPKDANSGLYLSVNQINLERIAPWLQVQKWNDQSNSYVDTAIVYAGASLPGFFDVVYENKGVLLLPFIPIVNKFAFSPYPEPFVGQVLFKDISAQTPTPSSAAFSESLNQSKFPF